MRAAVLDSRNRMSGAARRLLGAGNIELRNVARYAVQRIDRRLMGSPEVAYYTRHIAYVIKRLDVDCVIDVGAHYGEYAMLLRRSGYKGKILSVEPVQSSFRVLIENSSGDDRWKCFRCALGTSDTTLTMHVSENSVYSSLGDASEFGLRRHSSMQTVHDELVPVRRLDDVFSLYCTQLDSPPKRILLKVDTQGWDEQVLQGAPQLVERVIALQTEMSVARLYNHSVMWTESLARREAQGFRLSGLFPVCWRETWESALGYGLEVVEYDALLVRPLGPRNA